MEETTTATTNKHFNNLYKNVYNNNDDEFSGLSKTILYSATMLAEKLDKLIKTIQDK